MPIFGLCYRRNPLASNSPQTVGNRLQKLKSEQSNENNNAITLTNVGGDTAAAISIRLKPDIKAELTSGLKNTNEPVNLTTRIPMLEPQTKSYAFNSKNYSSRSCAQQQTSQSKRFILNGTTALGSTIRTTALNSTSTTKSSKKKNGIVVEHDAKRIQQIRQETVRDQKS